jgi:hypothetical protein
MLLEIIVSLDVNIQLIDLHRIIVEIEHVEHEDRCIRYDRYHNRTAIIPVIRHVVSHIWIDHVQLCAVRRHRCAS